MKLKYLAAWNDARRKNAALYNKLLSGIPGLVLPVEADYARHVYHIYAVRVKKRYRFISFLGEKRVSCGIHYPVQIHRQKAYNFLGLKEGSFLVAEKCASEFVSLPMFPELTQEQIEYTAETIKEFFK